MNFLTSPDIGSSDYTLMVLEQRRSANANMYFLGGSNSNFARSLQFGYNGISNAYYALYNVGGIQIDLESFTDSGNRQTEPFRIWSITYNSNIRSVRMHLNGHLVGTSFPNTTDMIEWTSPAVGLFWNGTSYFYTGNVKEIAIFKTGLPEDQRQLMEGYLATKWGIQQSLLSNTPVSTLHNLTGMTANMLTLNTQLITMPFLSSSALLGGRNVLRFDTIKTMFLNYINSNTSYTYALQPVQYPREFSLFYIARHVHSNTTFSRLIIQGTSNTAYYGYNTAQRKGFFTLDGCNIELNGFAANCNWDMWSFTKNTEGMASIYYFGSNINTAYTNSGFDGMGINMPDSNSRSDCEVGEILLYDRFLGSNERNQVETYLANKYLMTSNLSQPFSNVPQARMTNVISARPRLGLKGGFRRLFRIARLNKGG